MPRRIKRGAIVSFVLILFVAVCAGALTYTVRRSPSSSNEADKDLPVLKIGVTDNDPYVYGRYHRRLRRYRYRYRPRGV